MYKKEKKYHLHKNPGLTDNLTIMIVKIIKPNQSICMLLLIRYTIK